MQVRELAKGLWYWTGRHPGWTPGDGGPVPMYARAEMAMDKVAAPSFESGQSTLQVRVDATIELEK